MHMVTFSPESGGIRNPVIPIDASSVPGKIYNMRGKYSEKIDDIEIENKKYSWCCSQTPGPLHHRPISMFQQKLSMKVSASHNKSFLSRTHMVENVEKWPPFQMNSDVHNRPGDASTTTGVCDITFNLKAKTNFLIVQLYVLYDNINDCFAVLKQWNKTKQA